MNRIGKIEEETQLSDLDRLERELENEIEDAVNNDNAAPAQNATSFFGGTNNRRQSKFSAAPRVRSAFFPGQSPSVSGKLGESQPLVPLSYSEKTRKLKAANDSSPQSKFMTAPQSSGSRFMNKTMGTLLALGAVPMKLLSELGFFRYVKERQFNSLLRLEKSLGQGHEDAEQFLRANPKALKKKAPEPTSSF